MTNQYDYNTKIDPRDIDGNGHCRPSALLGHLQQAATEATENSPFSRKELLERYGAVWILARMWYELERPLRWQEELTVRTWHRGGRIGTLYRDFDLFSNGEFVGQAVSLWGLMHQTDRKVIKLANIPGLTQDACPEASKDIVLGRLRMPQQMAVAERRLMHYSDTDINAHVNNTRYADFACDAIRVDLLPPELYVRSMQLHYHAECRAGETIDLLTQQQDGYFVQGVDETGKERFGAHLILGRDSA